MPAEGAMGAMPNGGAAKPIETDAVIIGAGPVGLDADLGEAEAPRVGLSPGRVHDDIGRKLLPQCRIDRVAVRRFLR